MYTLCQGLAINPKYHQLPYAKKNIIEQSISLTSSSQTSSLQHQDQASPHSRQPKPLTSATNTNWFSAKLKRQRNLLHFGPPSNHGSDQKNILVLSLTTLTKFSSNQLPIPNSSPHLIPLASLHHEESLRFSSLTLPPSRPYLAHSTLNHKLLCYACFLRHHLSNKIILNSSILLTPQPNIILIQTNNISFNPIYFPNFLTTLEKKTFKRDSMGILYSSNHKNIFDFLLDEKSKTILLC
jgi:hypothetical protein